MNTSEIRKHLLTARNHITLAMNELEALEQGGGAPHEDLPFTDPLTELTLWCDGGSRGNPGEGYGSYAIIPTGGYAPVEQDTGVFGQGMTNNESEYAALLWGLKQLRKGLKVSQIGLTVKTDSALVQGQLQEGWAVNADNLRPMWIEAKALLASFASWRIEKVPRAEVVAVLGH